MGTAELSDGAEGVPTVMVKSPPGPATSLTFALRDVHCP